MSDYVSDVLKDGIIGGHHGEDEQGGKAKPPHDGGGKGGPKRRFAPQAKGHGGQTKDGGQRGEDNGTHTHMATPYNGQIELLWTLFPVAVNKINENEGIIDHNPREGQEPNEGHKGEGIVAHQQTDEDPKRYKGNGDHNNQGLGKGVELQGEDEEYHQKGQNGRTLKFLE